MQVNITMKFKHESDTAAVLDGLMEEYHFTGETRFYRANLPKFLSTTDETGVFRMSAMNDPSEAIVDIYGQGHVTLAQQVGPGLAFSENSAHQWLASDRTAVEVRLQDVLDQGGLVYPVESVITDRIWYLTLPNGGVSARKAG